MREELQVEHTNTVSLCASGAEKNTKCDKKDEQTNKQTNGCRLDNVHMQRFFSEETQTGFKKTVR